MGETPDQLKADIEETRRGLSADVDALTDRISPSRIARRRTDAIKSSAGGVRDRVMGSASSVTDTAGSAPGAVATKAQGNPLAAGLIGFGAGLLIASLLPTTEAEEQLGAAVKEKGSDFAEPVKQAAQQQVQQAKEALAPAAQDAAEQLRQSATNAAQTTADHAKAASSDVADDAKTAADQVRS